MQRRMYAEQSGRIANARMRFALPKPSEVLEGGHVYAFEDGLEGIVELANQRKGGIVVNDRALSIPAASGVIERLGDAHLDFFVDTYPVAATNEQMPAHARQGKLWQEPRAEVHGHHFRKRGNRLRLGPRDVTKEYLLGSDAHGHQGNPHRLVRQALVGYAQHPFVPVAGWTWHSYLGGAARVFSDVDLVEGWRWAAALDASGVELKITPNSGQPVIYVPSRDYFTEGYPISFRNLPSGDEAYSQWSNLFMDALSSPEAPKAPPAFFDTMTSASTHGQYPFTVHGIAGYLLLGLRHFTSVKRPEGTRSVPLPPVDIIPFPCPSAETFAFYDTLAERVFQLEPDKAGRRAHGDSSRLSQARMQALMSARNYAHVRRTIEGMAPEETKNPRLFGDLYFFANAGRFTESYVREGFRIALANHPLR